MTRPNSSQHPPRGPVPPGDRPSPPQHGIRRRAWVIASAGTCLVTVALAAGIAPQLATEPHPAPRTPSPPANRHRVEIRQPITQPRVDTGRTDAQGRPITVSCGSCHATSAPRRDTRSSVELDEFHQGLVYQHGNLTCLSCHDATNYDQLRLADGRGVPFPDAMALCSQCHGPQFRDYSRGSHGGMTGFWDLSRGPRLRNHCVDCHDPHAPHFPVVTPSFPLPLDRGLGTQPKPSRRHE